MSRPRTDDKGLTASRSGVRTTSAPCGVCSRAPTEAKTSKDLNPGLKDKYFNARVVSHPRKNIDVAFAYKNDKLAGGSATETKTSEIAVWAQVSF